jgi:hypothetical protein
MSGLERESPSTCLGDLQLGRGPKHPAAATSISKQDRSYKRLDRHLSRGGFKYEQLGREKDIAIYSQTWQSCSEPSTAFEVIRVRRHGGKKIKGQWVGPSEFYPSSSGWGKCGFSFTDKDAAFAKLRELLRRSVRSGKQ